ncbi:MAG: hypothetical protein EKK62_14350 [Acidimicrobiia bacterium]|nr:hypothetical protein [Microthrixaceae bacterium]RTL05607.1 MAG: hypothetical protein EKK62_14350 [Acidimicrobiia bacterium]MCB9375115.1 hypothetical protein [Microthrixaceae bacterium]MCB9401990.1 hypothetical protein [Microthrixaceae bacterium]MCO5305506.1 hypothetical protein [Microthrixaceae bacterium]
MDDRRRVPVPTPSGWTIESTRGFGPFVTRIRYRLADGTIRVWRSRDHRKGLDRPGVPRRTWWIAVLFCIGSTCFTVGPLPAYESWVGTRWVGLTFFVGSIFFTSASYLCFVEASNAPDAVVDDPQRRHRGPFRLISWRPHSIDWWSTGVQLVGTVYFNVMTFLAMYDGWDTAQANRLVWRPDTIGSICFLVASYLAWAEVCHSAGRLRLRDVSWWIVVLNLLGSVFFGVSAVGAYTLGSGELVNEWLDNAGTVAGGVCFFVAAAMLIPEARSKGAPA